MKNYKVGDRIWIKDMKEFGTIQEIKGDGYHSDLKSGIDFSHFDNIHQTADSMFEELGYEVENGKDYIEYRDEDNMREITIYTDEKTVNCCYYDYEDELPLRFTIQEHQAIHQKLIELGYIE